MPTLLQDIKTSSDWLINAFSEDDSELDYTVKSLLELDRFFQRYVKDGQLIKQSKLANNFGPIMFAVSCYIGETLIRNVPDSVWVTDDNDAQGELNISVRFPNGTICFPGQRMLKRFQNGLEDGIYPFGYELTKEYINEEFDESFWQIEKEVALVVVKPWWKFW